MRAIHLLRKPLSESNLARNVLKHGTGGINVGGARIATGGRPHREVDPKPEANGTVYAGRQDPGSGFDGGSKAIGETTLGRWPANLILEHRPGCQVAGQTERPGYTINRWDDGAYPFGGAGGQDKDYTSHETEPEVVDVWDCVEGCPVAELDASVGLVRGAVSNGKKAGTGYHGNFGPQAQRPGYADEGGPSMFFKQVGSMASGRPQDPDKQVGWPPMESSEQED